MHNVNIKTVGRIKTGDLILVMTAGDILLYFDWDICIHVQFGIDFLVISTDLLRHFDRNLLRDLKGNLSALFLRYLLAILLRYLDRMLLRDLLAVLLRNLSALFVRNLNRHWVTRRFRNFVTLLNWFLHWNILTMLLGNLVALLGFVVSITYLLTLFSVTGWAFMFIRCFIAGWALVLIGLVAFLFVLSPVSILTLCLIGSWTFLFISCLVFCLIGCVALLLVNSLALRFVGSLISLLICRLILNSAFWLMVAIPVIWLGTREPTHHTKATYHKQNCLHVDDLCTTVPLKSTQPSFIQSSSAYKTDRLM